MVNPQMKILSLITLIPPLSKVPRRMHVHSSAPKTKAQHMRVLSQQHHAHALFTQWSQTQFLEGQSSAKFSSNQF